MVVEVTGPDWSCWDLKEDLRREVSVSRWFLVLLGSGSEGALVPGEQLLCHVVEQSQNRFGPSVPESVWELLNI